MTVLLWVGAIAASCEEPQILRLRATRFAQDDTVLEVLGLVGLPSILRKMPGFLAALGMTHLTLVAEPSE